MKGERKGLYRETIVLCSTRLGTEELQPDTKTDRATDIDNLPLVIHEPQPVRFCERIYSIEREGLYRFFDLGWCRKDKKSGRPQCLNPEKRYIRNLIHFREDVGSFFQAISRLHVGGSAHQSWSIDRLKQQSMRGRLSVSCGRISEFTCELLKMQNIRCRLVGIVTLEDWKTTGFGHTMFEYFDEKKKK